jgi:predicted kinase
MRTHYPRTRHLPWSPGATADDVRVTDLSGLRGREVVVTEKLDGENTTLYRDGLHARSLDSAHHPSRAWVKALQGRIGHHIPEGWRVCGENMFARHSIAYDDLDSYFYGFSVWDERGRCLDWDRTVLFVRRLGIPVPRVLWRGTLDEKALRALKSDPARQEGYVVRTTDGFAAEEFGQRVAKWVRAGHVRTDTHWMHAAVVPNGLGPGAALWDVRSGGPVDVTALGDGDAEAVARLDLGGRTGDDRLAGVLAALLHGEHRAALAPRLAPSLGMPLARRVADLVGLHTALHRPYPDEERRAGLVRMSYAADLGVLHAVAAATARTAEAHEQVAWSCLHADEVEPPAGLADAFADLPEPAAVRCRSAPPRTPGVLRPGSGKSTFARSLDGTDAYVSLDDLRAARGSRADQKANDEILRTALGRLDTALAAGGTVVWDATSLSPRQRSLVHAVARRRDALTTHAVVLVAEDELVRRNEKREHPVPPQVLTAQLHRFVPPYPGQAHRTWYIGASGTVEEEA